MRSPRRFSRATRRIRSTAVVRRGAFQRKNLALRDFLRPTFDIPSSPGNRVSARRRNRARTYLIVVRNRAVPKWTTDDRRDDELRLLHYERLLAATGSPRRRI